MDAWRDEVRGLWPETEPILDAIAGPEALTLARYAHFTLRRPFASRVVCIGDSAHATSPQLGQGANMALLDAMALGVALTRQTDLSEAFRAYANARRRHIRAYQLASRLFTPVFQSDSRVLPELRDRLSSPMVGLPFVPTLLARIVAGELIDPLRPIQRLERRSSP